MKYICLFVFILTGCSIGNQTARTIKYECVKGYKYVVMPPYLFWWTARAVGKCDQNYSNFNNFNLK